jgi:hypothetical protein
MSDLCVFNADRAEQELGHVIAQSDGRRSVVAIRPPTVIPGRPRALIARRARTFLAGRMSLAGRTGLLRTGFPWDAGLDWGRGLLALSAIPATSASSA